jgi:hypothetical protein
MPYDFPNTPTSGQTVTMPDGSTRQWDGTKWHAGATGTAYLPANLVANEVVYGAASGGGAAQDTQLVWNTTTKTLAIGSSPLIGRLLRDPTTAQWELMVNANWTGSAWAFDDTTKDAFALLATQLNHRFEFAWAPASANPPVWTYPAQLNSTGAWSTAGAHRFRYLVSTARLKMTANVTPPASASWQTVNWSALDYDTDGYWVSPNFVVPIAGYYQVTFSVILPTAPAAPRGLGIFSGAVFLAAGTLEGSGASLTWEGSLAAGAAVSPQIYNVNVADVTLYQGSCCVIRYVGE